MGGKVDGADRRALEDQLVEMAEQRSVADFGRSGDRWELPAAVLQQLCGERVSEVSRYGLRVAHAHVTGAADLRAVDVPFGLEFRGCVFDEPLVVEGAQLHELALVQGTALPGLLANGVQIRRDLDVSGARLHGALRTTASTSMTSAIWLTEADIGGRLLCVGTEIVGPADRALQADRTHFGGNIRMIHGFKTDGEIRLIAARVDGSLDLTGAQLHPKSNRAIDFSEAHVGGSLFIIDDDESRGGLRPVIRGRIELSHAVVEGRMWIRNASLVGPASGEGGHHYLPARARTVVTTSTGGTPHRSTLYAPRLRIGGDLLFTGSCHVDGGIDLQMAEIGGDVRVDDQVLQNPGDRTLDLTSASVGGTLSARGLDSRGTIALAGTRVLGAMLFNGARLGGPVDGEGEADRSPSPGDVPEGASRREVVCGTGLNVMGDVELADMTASGGAIAIRVATIRGNVDGSGAKLSNRGADALVLDNTIVDGDVRLADGFEADGTVSLVGLTTHGILNLTGATITNASSEPALVAVNARSDGGMFLRWSRVEPWVNLDGASTSVLWDDPGNWPPRFSIVGFEYRRFWKEPALSLWDVEKRIAWLARQEPLDAAPYEQLAGVLRARGQPQRAQMVQIAYLRRERSGLNLRGRAAGWLWDKLTRYGFQPWRVVVLMAVLILGLTGLLSFTTPREALRAEGASGVTYEPDGPVGARGPGAEPCGDGDVRCFRPVFYAVDVVVPLVDLGQRQTWRVEPHEPWGTSVEVLVAISTLLGWTFSTVFALSFTHLARSR